MLSILDNEFHVTDLVFSSSACSQRSLYCRWL